MRDLLEFVLGLIVLVVLIKNVDVVISVLGEIVTIICDFILVILKEVKP